MDAGAGVQLRKRVPFGDKARELGGGGGVGGGTDLVSGPLHNSDRLQQQHLLFGWKSEPQPAEKRALTGRPCFGDQGWGGGGALW